MKVAVGSKNPVKIKAVEEAFKEFFKGVEVISVEVESGTRNQPFNEEIKKGAENRAKNALKATDADFGVGTESGIIEKFDAYYINIYTAICSRNLEIHGAWSGTVECPPDILEELKNGRELGEVADNLTGRHNIKQQEGLVGIWTRGKIPREHFIKESVMYALIPFLNEKYYKKRAKI